MGLVRATQIAAAVGKAFAVLFAIVGFVGTNVILLVIAFFVYVGAEGESRHVLARTLLGELRVRDVMTPRAGAISPEESVAGAADRMLAERRLSFPVVDAARVVGVVTLDAIQRVAPERRRETTVREAMSPPLIVSADDPVRDALRLFAPAEGALVCVLDGDGRLVGTLSQLDVLRALKLRELRESQRHAWEARREGEARA
jgi:CBS domain-containing protein